MKGSLAKHTVITRPRPTSQACSQTDYTQGKPAAENSQLLPWGTQCGDRESNDNKNSEDAVGIRANGAFAKAKRHAHKQHATLQDLEFRGIRAK